MFKKLLLCLLIILSCSNATLQKFTDGESWYSVTRNDGISITRNRVGVLTTTPSYSLDVRGTVNATSYIGAFNGSLPTYVVTNNYHGSVAANYFIGDGSLLTNIIADTISGDVTLQSVTINGSLYVSSSAVSIFGDSVTINGNLYVSGNSNLGSGAGLSISQNSYSPNISPNYTTPNVVGQVWINTANYNIYMAAHTNNYAGWAYIGRGATSAFTKDTVPGLVGWWESDAMAYITKDGGNNVTAFYDMSDGAKNFVNSSATKPVWTENVFGTLPGIYFGGGAYLYTNRFTAIGQPTTYFLVIKPTAWSNGQTQYIIGGHQAGGGAYTGQAIGKNGSNLNTTLYGYNFGAQGPALTNTTPVLLTCTFNGSSSSIAINDNAPVTLNIGQAGIDDLHLGAAAYATSLPYTGYFGAGMLFSSTLSDANKTIVRQYLNTKYGLW